MSDLSPKSTKWKSLLIEALLVTFSVLLALLLNQWRQNINDRALVAKALQTIRAEIMANQAEIEQKLPVHELLLQSIKEKNAGDIGLQMPLLRDTAMEIIETAGAAPHMEFSDITILSEIHEMHTTYKKNAAVITQLVYSEMFTVSPATYDKFLRGYAILIGDVINFEKALLQQYAEALARLSQ